MFIVDAHLDLAYNWFNNGRSPLLSLAELRQQDKKIPPANQKQRGQATVTFDELRQAGCGLVFGTLYITPASSPFGLADENAVYHNAQEAHQLAMQQLDYYHRLADETDFLRIVRDTTSLQEVITSQASEKPLLGLVPLMEGADPIREPEEAEYWYERDLRLIGPAWDDTRYSPGAWREQGGLTRDGFRLLEVMEAFKLILDITHMSEKASLQALDAFHGTAVATHANARALVPGPRQLSDTQIQRLGERNSVIGIVLYNQFLKRDYKKGDGKHLVTLEEVVAHVDHICQLLGSADHVGIGSDFDGGFGAQDIPDGLNSAADLPLIGTLLQNRGYTLADVEKIMGGNWVRLLGQAWQ